MNNRSSTKPRIDICIATYKRPDLLRKLLLSLITQETGEEFSFAIIVADNDAQRSAETTVREFKTNGQTIIYDVEPEQNISLARNKSLSHATGDYIATIDDDEYADSHWLLNLYKTMVSYAADVVHGPVTSVFHEKTPNYIKKSALFNLPNPPTGSMESYVCATQNSLFRRRLIENTPIPFDPSFGRTGGGDSHFFENLKKQGYKMVWCREAQVFEFISPERANLVWVLKRNFRIGNTWLRASNKGSFNTNLSREWEVFYILKDLAILGCAVPFYTICGIFNLQKRRHYFSRKAVNCLERIAFYAGIITYFLGFRYEEYHE
jgi:succinoglycan biosynthesis protein ExoM